MVINHITTKLLLDGQIKDAGVLDPHTRIIIKCKLMAYYLIDGVWIFKLKPNPKQWSAGPDVIFRSMEEVF